MLIIKTTIVMNYALLILYKYHLENVKNQKFISYNQIKKIVKKIMNLLNHFAFQDAQKDGKIKETYVVQIKDKK